MMGDPGFTPVRIPLKHTQTIVANSAATLYINIFNLFFW